jgi:hypothetical protein
MLCSLWEIKLSFGNGSLVKVQRFTGSGFKVQSSRFKGPRFRAQRFRVQGLTVKGSEFQGSKVHVSKVRLPSRLRRTGRVLRYRIQCLLKLLNRLSWLNPEPRTENP